MTGKIKITFTKGLDGFISIEDAIEIDGLTCYKDGKAVGKVIEVNPLDDAIEATIRIDSPTLVEELMISALESYSLRPTVTEPKPL